MAHTDVTSIIERLEVFEERAGIRFEALSAQLNDHDEDEEYYIQVQGEIHALEGTSLPHDVELKLLVYDSSQRLILSREDSVDSETFFAFDTFYFNGFIPKIEISKIRIIPKSFE